MPATRPLHTCVPDLKGVHVHVYMCTRRTDAHTHTFDFFIFLIIFNIQFILICNIQLQFTLL